METTQTFDAFVAEHFGVLRAGTHAQDGEACVLEAWNAYRGCAWSDSPNVAGCFDLRLINDIDVRAEIRTPWMVHLMQAYADSLSWSPERAQQVITRIVILTVQRLIAELPSMSDEIRSQCRYAQTTEDAWEAACAAEAAWAARAAETARAAREAAWAAEAARAAREAAWAAEAARVARAARAAEAARAVWVAWVAEAAARAARAAAWAAEAAQVASLITVMSVEQVFLTACALWLEAAQGEHHDHCAM